MKKYWSIFMMLVLVWQQGWAQDITTVFSSNGGTNLELCTGKVNEVSYEIKNFLQASGIQLTEVSMSLPAGLSFVKTGNFTSVTFNGTTYESVAVVNNSITLALPSAVTLPTQTSIFVEFAILGDCEYEIQTANILPLKINYTKSGNGLSYTSENESNQNTFTPSYAQVLIFYSDESVKPHKRNVDLVRKLTLKSSGSIPLKEVDLDISVTASEQQFFSVSSLVGTTSGPIAAVITPIGSGKYKVVFEPALPIGVNFEFNETYKYAKDCGWPDLDNSTKLQVLTVAKVPCGALNCISTGLNDRRPQISRSIALEINFPSPKKWIPNFYPVSSGATLTSAEQSTIMLFGNPVNQSDMLNFKIQFNKIAKIKKAYLVSNSSGANPIEIQIMAPEPQEDYYTLVFPSNDVFFDDLDGEGLYNDLNSGSDFYFKVDYEFNQCNTPPYNNLLQAFASFNSRCHVYFDWYVIYNHLYTPANTSSIKFDSKGFFEYDKIEPLTIIADQPNLINFPYGRMDVTNRKIQVKLKLPSELQLTVPNTTVSSSAVDGDGYITHTFIAPANLKYCNYVWTGYQCTPPKNDIHINISLKNTNPCLVFSKRNITCSMSDVNVPDNGCSFIFDSNSEEIMLFSEDLSCENPIYGPDGGDGSANCRVRANDITVKRTTYGYKPEVGYNSTVGAYSNYYAKTLNPLNKITEANVAAQNINLKAALENDEFTILAKGIYKGTSQAICPNDVNVLLTYEYGGNLLELPFDFVGNKQAVVSVKDENGLTLRSFTVYSNITHEKVLGTDVRKVLIPIPSSQLGGMETNQQIFVELKMKVRPNFSNDLADPQGVGYFSKSFRSKFYYTNPEAVIFAKTNFDLFQYSKPKLTDGDNYLSACAEYKQSFKIDCKSQENIFINEFRPIVFVDNMKMATQYEEFYNKLTTRNRAISFGSVLYKDNYEAVYLGYGYPSSLIFIERYDNKACVLPPSLGTNEYKARCYDYGRDLTNDLTIPSTTNLIPLRFEIKGTVNDIYSGNGSIAEWELPLETENKDAYKFDYYFQWKNLNGAKVKLLSYKVGTSEIFLNSNTDPYDTKPVKFDLSFTTVNETQGIAKVKFKALIESCGNDGVNVNVAEIGFKSVCKGEPLTCNPGDFSKQTLKAIFQNSNLVVSNSSDHLNLTTGICNGFEFESTIFNQGSTKMNDLLLGVNVPDGLAYETGMDQDGKLKSYFEYGTSKYELPTCTPATLATLKTLGFKSEGLFGWKLSELVTGQVHLEGAKSVKIHLRVVSQCNEQIGNTYDPDQPFLVSAYGTKECGSADFKQISTKVLPKNYTAPKGTVTTTFHISDFMGCDLTSQGCYIKLENLQAKSIVKDFYVDLYVPKGITLNAALSPDGSFVLTDFTLYRWLLNTDNVTKTFNFDLKFSQPYQQGKNMSFFARVRQKVDTDLCATDTNPNPTSTECSKVYGLVGRDLVATPAVRFSTYACDLQGPTHICKTLAEIPAADFQYIIYPKDAYDTYNWVLPTFPAGVTATIVSKAHSVETKSNWLKLKYAITAMTADVTSLTPLILTIKNSLGATIYTKSLPITIKMPLEEPKTLKVSLPCPDLSVPLVKGETYMLNILNYSGGTAYNLDLNGDDIADLQTNKSPVPVTFTRVGTYNIKVLNSGMYCSTGEGETKVTVKELKLDADHMAICTNGGTPSQAVIALTDPNTATSADHPLSTLASDYYWYKDGKYIDPLKTAELTALGVTISGSSITVKEPGKYKVVLKQFSCAPNVNDYTKQSGMMDPKQIERIFKSTEPRSVSRNTDFAGINGGAALNEIQESTLDGKIIYFSITIGRKICIDEPPECEPPLTCINCQEMCERCFRLENNQEYLLSGWVKEEVAQLATTKDKGGIKVEFLNSSDALIQQNIASMLPDQPLIDGWKRVLVRFKVPSTYDHVVVKLNSATDYDIMYDDIRIHPVDGTMQSFVYDPISLRLMSTLDDNNYASFYEYDNEGKLVRVKKETARGIMTIKENRDNIKK